MKNLVYINSLFEDKIFVQKDLLRIVWLARLQSLMENAS